MAPKKQYEKGFEDGRKEEAGIALDNLIALQDEINSVGYDNERSYLNNLIKELSEYLG